MKKFQKKTFGSKNEQKDEGLKTSSPPPKVFADKYIEELEPADKKEYVTYKQISFIWTKKGWAIVGIKFGEAASRNITRDIRKIIEENIPLKKIKYEKEPDKIA